MSRVRKPSGPAAGAPRKPGAPGPERKAAPKGPVVTPQALGIVFFLILVIGVIVFWQMVVVKFNNQMITLNNTITQTQGQIQTYESKGKMLPEAKEVNTAIREKLRTLDYLFLQDQDSVVPFFEDILIPIIATSKLRATADTKLEVDKYTFKINMAMDPFNTLPASRLFENAQDIFGIDYLGEKEGVPVDKVLDTRPPNFLFPYTIKMTKFAGTYENVKDFIDDVQTRRNAVLITVHCFKNNKSDNYGLYRTVTTWDLSMTVYFMNPEAQASGDNPPDPPGAKTC